MARFRQKMPAAGPFLVRQMAVYPQLDALREDDDGERVAVLRRAAQAQRLIPEVIQDGEFELSVLTAAFGHAGFTREKAKQPSLSGDRGREPQAPAGDIHVHASRISVSYPISL